MAARECGTGKLYVSMEQAANAIANGDTLDVYPGAVTTNQDLTHLASHTGWTIRNFQGPRIAVTLKIDTMLKPGAGTASQIGSGSDLGFAITALGGSGGNPGVVQVGSGGTLRIYDSAVTAIFGNPCALRIEAGASAAIGYGYRSTFTGYGGDAGVGLYGGGAACTFYGYDCTYAGGGWGVNGAGAISNLYAERGTFTAATGIRIYSAGTVDVRYSDFTGTTGVVHAASGNPTVVLWRNTWKCGTTDYDPNLGNSKSGVSVKGNWFYRMKVQLGAGLWNDNRYDTYITGAGLGTKGAQDAVCSLADAHFTNAAGGDFSLTSASLLINAGVDAAGQNLDHDGLAAVKGASADVGSHEYQLVDCAVVPASCVFVDPTHVDIVFAGSGGGPAVPLQASAENAGNWTVACAADPTVAATAVVRQAALTYRATLNHAAPGLADVVFTPVSVVTDFGGACTGSATLAAPALDCGVGSVAQTSGIALAVTFVAQGGGSQVPLQASAEDPGNWIVTGSVSGLRTVTLAARLADLLYAAVLDGYIVPGETITVDVSAIETDQGGQCDEPGTGQFVSVYGGLSTATLDDAETLRITYVDGGTDTAPVEADATDVSKVVVQGALGGLVASSIAKASAFVYMATLSRPTAPGEACTVDLTTGAPVMTIGGGEVAAPGDLPFVGVDWPDARFAGVQALTSRLLRARFDTSPWYAVPHRVLARDGSLWSVATNDGDAIAVTFAYRDKADHAWLLVLSEDLTEALFEIDTSAVPSSKGGHC